MKSLRRVRLYEGDGDLRAMQELTQRMWSPDNVHHIGDLAWGRKMFSRELVDWPIALWETNEGRLIAWGWGRLPGDLRLQVDAEHPEVLEDVLSWFDSLAQGGVQEIDPLSADSALLDALARRGFQRQDDAPFYHYHAHSLTQLEAIRLPRGFAVRPVNGESDLAQRVAVHRAAWHPSRVTCDSYQNVMSTWPYRTGLDWVVEAPDGSFAASCLIWYDDVNRVGLLEPVGTHPEYRNLGLARAVSVAAMRALREMGAKAAIVCPIEGDGDPAPSALYRAIGFTPYARTVHLRMRG